jgi:hypothetical protein
MPESQPAAKRCLEKNKEIYMICLLGNSIEIGEVILNGAKRSEESIL